jgi:Uma2 family endonuclease
MMVGEMRRLQLARGLVACFADATRISPSRETTSMQMAQRTRRWTLAELHRLPDDGNKYEVVRGELFVTPAPSDDHEELLAVLRELLQPYVTEQQLGRLYSPRAIIRARGSEVEPDLMVRPVPAHRRRGWAAQPVPLLVVEVISEATRRRDYGEKRSYYLALGVPEYWIIDRDERVCVVVRPGHDDTIQADTLEWQPRGATKSLRIDVAALFRKALD